MLIDRKKALKQLQKKLIEMIRELESDTSLQPLPVHIATDDFEFKLEYSRKLNRFLVLLKHGED